LPSLRPRFEIVPVQASPTLAWFWEVGIGTRKTHGNGKRTGKFAIRRENLGSWLCLAEKGRGSGWFHRGLYATAGCTSWKLHRGKFISEITSLYKYIYMY